MVDIFYQCDSTVAFQCGSFNFIFLSICPIESLIHIIYSQTIRETCKQKVILNIFMLF